MHDDLPANDARIRWSEILQRAGFGKERIRVTRHGKGVAALVPIEDLELLEQLEDQIDLDAARAALREARTKGSSAWADVKAALNL